MFSKATSSGSGPRCKPVSKKNIAAGMLSLASDSESSDDELCPVLDAEAKFTFLEAQRVRNDPRKTYFSLIDIMKDTAQVIVTRIVDPSDFYIRVIMGADKGRDILAEILEEMQAQYNNPDSLVKLRHEPFLDVEFYLWKNQATNRWERVRIYARNKVERTCLIFVIDSGEINQANFDELYHLHKQFLQFTQELHRVFLLDVKPIQGTDEDDDEAKKVWPEEAILALKELALNKKFHGVAANRVIDQEDCLFYENSFQYGVILYSPKDKYTLNSELCHLKCADAVGLGGGRLCGLDEALEEHTQLEKLQKLSELTIDGLRTIMETPNLPGPEEMSVFDRLYRRIFVERLAFDDYLVQATWDWLQPGLKTKVGGCVISYFLSCGAFYIHLTDQEPLYQVMLNAIADVVANEALETLQPEDLKGGEFVIAPHFDGDHSLTCSFVRGVVRDIKGAAGVSVLMIDHGKILFLKPRQLRLLPEKFMKIPSFCYRAHLDARNIQPQQSNWLPIAKDFCQRVVAVAAKAGRKSYFWRYADASTVVFEELSQQCEIDLETNRWVASKPNNLKMDKTLSEMKHHLLIAPHFISIGIELGFDVMVRNVKDPHQTFKLDKIIDNLAYHGYAVKSKTKSK